MRLAKLLVAMICVAMASASHGAEPKMLAQGPGMPILAWASIPWNQATPDRFRELSDAGFTHSYSGASNAETMRKLLDDGHKYGIKQFISLPALESDPEGTVRAFKDHPANGGYYLRDEPGASLFPKLGTWSKRIQSVDAVNPCYINLFPTYGNPGQWETPDYPTYVKQFLAEVPTPMLSFDHYPIVRTGADAASDRIRGDFYYNLEVCSLAARGAKRPLWAFVLSVAHNPYPVPTAAHLKLQAYSNLAYGAQVIQYFTYWTVKSDTWNFHQAPIEVDGKRTPTYDLVKAMNAELQAVRGAFIGSEVQSVGHTGKALPTGTTAYSPAAPVNSVEAAGEGTVVSVLAKEQQRYLVVVNRDIHNAQQTTIKLDGSKAIRHAQKDGMLTPVGGAELSTELPPGDAIILTWSVE